jgi:hypothetical protein
MDVSRHKSVDTLRGYARDSRAVQGSCCRWASLKSVVCELAHKYSSQGLLPILTGLPPSGESPLGKAAQRSYSLGGFVLVMSGHGQPLAQVLRNYSSDANLLRQQDQGQKPSFPGDEAGQERLPLAH